MTPHISPQDNRKENVILFFLALVLGLLLIFGCNPTKKIEREDNKAVNRVNASLPLQLRVVSPYLDAHPPDTTTRVQYIKGDVIKIPELIRDTTREHFIKDSLISIGKDCGQEAMNAYDLGWDEAEKYYLKNPVVRVDTFKYKRGVPVQMYNRMVDTAGMFAKQLYNELGKNEQLKDEVKGLNKKNDTLIFIIIGLSIVLLASVGFNIRSLFSPAKTIGNILRP